MAVHEIARMGIVHVPEGRRVFARLTVEENLEVGRAAARDTTRRADLKVGPYEQQDPDRVYHLFPVLKDRRRQPAGTLSGGEQQMLAIGRALMSRPRLLMLDEPSMGLAPLLVEKIVEALQAINREGVTLLLVEQNAAQALAIAHRGYVLETGRVALEGTSGELRASSRVRAAYLGG